MSTLEEFRSGFNKVLFMSLFLNSVVNIKSKGLKYGTVLSVSICNFKRCEQYDFFLNFRNHLVCLFIFEMFLFIIVIIPVVNC